MNAQELGNLWDKHPPWGAEYKHTPQFKWEKWVFHISLKVRLHLFIFTSECIFCKYSIFLNCMKITDYIDEDAWWLSINKFGKMNYFFTLHNLGKTEVVN